MIHVIATVDLAPGTRDAFLAEFHKVMPLVHAEEGCIAYGPCIDAESGFPTQFRIGPDRVTIVEQWQSVEALKAHAAAAHMKAYRTAVKDYVRGMELRVLAPA
jgi:quinol monooxygenase YgiN